MHSVRRILLVGCALGLLACPGGDKSIPPEAVLLFDVDFSSPENKVGEAPKVYEDGSTQSVPSLIPSQIFLGAPKVADALCGLEDQPAVFAVGGEPLGHVGLEFLLDQRYAHYHVELDVCIANLGVPPLQANEPQLAIFLDIPDAYALGFFERGRLVIVDQARGTDALTDPTVIGAWELGKPQRIALDFDVSAQTWSIASNGAKIFDGKLEASLPRAVRVVLRGNPVNVAAVDDIVIWAENDLFKDLPEPVEPETGTNE
jgi:hypothetical protein